MTSHYGSKDEVLHRTTREGLVARIKALEAELERVKSAAAEQGIQLPAPSSIAGSTWAGTEPLREPLTIAAKKRAKKAARKQAKLAASPASSRETKRKPRPFSTRVIALKLAYLGKNYGGFEFTAHSHLPSVEEVLWQALVKSRLIVPENPDIVDFVPFDYAKCGRTDKGVSAFGQVISLRVRSARPLPEGENEPVEEVEHDGRGDGGEDGETARQRAREPEKEFDPTNDEIQYPKVLNRLLPPDIRIIAWCPKLSPDFSARFSCRERRYRYFFTQPAFTPLPSILDRNPNVDYKDAQLSHHHPKGKKKALERARSRSAEWQKELKENGLIEEQRGDVQKPKEGWLDIEAMREAASYFEGLHDFRNFCKIDGGRQVSNYKRRMFEVKVEEVKDLENNIPYLTSQAFVPARDIAKDGERFPKVYSFNVYGSAFLWHQIRHMIAILFMVGQGLETPTVVEELLDVEKHPSRPHYEMADDAPLVLWDCVFPDLTQGTDQESRPDALPWIYGGSLDMGGDHGPYGMFEHLWDVWHGRKMDEILANRLLMLYSQSGDPQRKIDGGRDKDVIDGAIRLSRTYRLYLGAGGSRPDGKYVPMLQRPTQGSFDQINDRYAKRKGYDSSEAFKAGIAEKARRKYEAAGRGFERSVASETAVPEPNIEAEPVVVEDSEELELEIGGGAAAA